jgi:hypothetical protein
MQAKPRENFRHFPAIGSILSILYVFLGCKTIEKWHDPDDKYISGNKR